MMNIHGTKTDKTAKCSLFPPKWNKKKFKWKSKTEKELFGNKIEDNKILKRHLLRFDKHRLLVIIHNRNVNLVLNNNLRGHFFVVGFSF